MNEDRSICAPVLSVAMMAETGIFHRLAKQVPGQRPKPLPDPVHFTTVFRWSKAGKFPSPDLVVGGRELWAETTIREWAAHLLVRDTVGGSRVWGPVHPDRGLGSSRPTQNGSVPEVAARACRRRGRAAGKIDVETFGC